MRAIAKNRKKRIEQIFTHANRCLVHCLDDGFRGKDVDPQVALKALYEFDSNKLYEDETAIGRYRVKVHSNLWYDVLSQG